MSDQQTNTVQTQNTTTVSAQPSVEQSVPSQNNSVPQASSEEKNREEKNNNKIYVIIAVLLFILIIGELGFVFLYHNSAFKQLLPSFSIMSWMNEKNNPKNSLSTLKPTPTVQDGIIIPVPTGLSVVGTGAAADFTLHVEKVTEAPTDTSGDKPLKKLQYIEFDVSVTNNTGTTSLTPGMFYFQDAASGKLFMPANIFGHVPDYNWIDPAFSQRDVTVPGKNSLMTTAIPGGKTVNNLYLIYQIFPAEKGKLVWDTADTITEIKFGQPVVPAKIINYYLLNKIFEFNTTNNENNRIEVFSIP